MTDHPPLRDEIRALRREMHKGFREVIDMIKQLSAEHALAASEAEAARKANGGQA